MNNNSNPDDTQLDMQEYKKQLEILNTIYPYIQDDKPLPKTIPEIFGKYTDENFISDYLSYILNPSYNGAGLAPLKELVNTYYQKEDQKLDINNLFTDIKDSDIEIIREYSIIKGRIDILIKISNKMIIGIENKIFASEGIDQTLRYAESISKYGEDYEKILLVYLTLNKAEPQSDVFINLTYKDLLTILKNINIDFTKNIKQSIIFKDFIEHIERYLTMNNNLVISEKTKLFVENATMINDLREAALKDGKKIFTILSNFFKEKFPEKEWCVKISDNRECQQIYKHQWNKHKNKLDSNTPHLEFFINRNTILTNDEITFFIEIDNEKRSQELKNKLNNLGCLEPKENKIRHAFAQKSYPNKFKPNDNFNIEQCIEMLEEVNKDFNPIFDKIVKIIEEI